MDINWEQVQQLLTFLIIFVAPAILAKFKKKPEEEEEELEKETPLTKLKYEDMAGTKPISLEAIRKEEHDKRQEYLLDQQQKESRNIKEQAAKAKIEEMKKLALLSEEPVKVDSTKKREILGLSPRKAVILKEILAPPRGLEPY